MTVIDLLARYAHLLFALVWVGHNYASFIQNPRFVALQNGIDTLTLNRDLEQRMKREHGIFRYASLVVWLSGLLMLWQRGWLADALLLQGPLAVIGLGAWIGTLMLLNLWLVLWPQQQKLLGFVPASLEERVRCSRITFLSSRSNTILSMPLLFLMAAGGHGLQLFS
ncbi:urate hydroxylase PuuD [Pseudomonas paeninsulae]|uniref:urate hydroxylase PuuD n=1 Tax=Pseudomonas paeninsulae TaxID=3110772 RepID=UPI002D777946|nr:urate hydroxylase PuuD [Pseudomonas sp. IT1137]